MTGQQFGEIRTAINVDALNQYLRDHVPEIAAPVDVKQFSYGQSNPTYILFDQNKKRYVLRKKPPGELLSATAHAIEREYRILKALGTYNENLARGINDADAVPVPKVYCLCEEKQIVGTNFYIMEFIEGRIFADYRLLELPKQERRECWFAAIRTLAALHKVNPDKVDLKDFGKPQGFYTRQIKSLGRVSESQAQTKDKKTGQLVGPIPKILEFLEWFVRNVPQDENTLIHGDYKIDNLIFHPTEPRVIGILDWELSTRGHPLSDLGNLLQPFSLSCKYPQQINDPEEPIRTQARGELFMSLGDLSAQGCPVPTKEELIREYCKAMGRPYPIDNWTAVEAWAWFRLGVITQGIAARLAQGQASSQEAVLYASKFPYCSQAMFEVVQGSKAKL